MYTKIGRRRDERRNQRNGKDRLHADLTGHGDERFAGRAHFKEKNRNKGKHEKRFWLAGSILRCSIPCKQ